MTQPTERDIGAMYQLDESFREVRSMINTYWSKYSIPGIGMSHGRLITAIAEKGPLKASYLAERLHITCGAVTGLADKLIEHGMVVRQKQENDRRVVLLSLTELGQKRADDIMQIRNQLMMTLFANMTTEEMEQGLELFAKLKNNMLSQFSEEQE